MSRARPVPRLDGVGCRLDILGSLSSGPSFSFWASEDLVGQPVQRLNVYRPSVWKYREFFQIVDGSLVETWQASARA